jgi:hypothetical protein
MKARDFEALDREAQRLGVTGRRSSSFGRAA